MPNREQFQEGEESTDESGDWQSPDDNEDESDESDSSEEVDSPPRSELRSKQSQDPAGGRGKAAPPSTQVQKRTRTSSPEPSEKAAKQPKVAPSKPRKALPKIKVDVHVASAYVFWFIRLSSMFCLTHLLALTECVLEPFCAATSGTSMNIYKEQDDE